MKAVYCQQSGNACTQCSLTGCKAPAQVAKVKAPKLQQANSDKSDAGHVQALTALETIFCAGVMLAGTGIFAAVARYAWQRFFAG